MSRRYSNVDTAETDYENIKRKIENGTANSAEAIGTLKQIITDLPGTWIADLARQLIDEL